MLGNKNSRGAKHRFLILMYLAYFILSLAPTIVAPPERGFSQGQPEMQQAMDNMVAHGVLIKKNHGSPSTEVNYPALLTSKTSSLLAEAEHVLNNLPDSKEKQWVEGFVNRMRAIATMLEKTAKNSKQQHFLTNHNSVSGTPVPEGLPIQPTWPATPAVPGFNPFQKSNRMMSKFPVTSPELSQVLPENEYPTERQVVTKPALQSSKKEDEEDELVRELESLHQETAPQVPFHNSLVLDHTPDITSPATPESVLPKNIKEENLNAKVEKAKLKDRLIQEIAEFQRLGGVIPKELINALDENEEIKSDFKPPSTTNNQNQKTEINNFQTMNDHTVNREAMERLDDLNNEEKKISKSNLENFGSEENVPYQAQRQSPYIKPNLTFPNTHLKFHPNPPALPKQVGNYFYAPPKTKEQPLPGELQNTNQNLQKPNPFNLHGNHMNGYPKYQHVNHIPDTIKQKMSESDYKKYSHYFAAYNDYLAKYGYGSYPYMHQNNRNSTLNQLPMVSPYLTKPPINHQIDTQLSDEMKRQLRDGKIVVLSDSLVRSNFEQNQDKKANESETNKPMSDKMNHDNTTQVPN